MDDRAVAGQENNNQGNAGRGNNALPATVGRIAQGFARTVTGPLRYLIVPLWIVVAVAAYHYLPVISSVGGTGAIGLLAPRNAPAVRAEEQALHQFVVPLVSRIAIVQRDPHGLSRAAQRRVLDRALAIDRHPNRYPFNIAAAVPIINDPLVFPAAREKSTTAITYLVFEPWHGLYDQRWRALQYALHTIDKPGDGLVGVTGIIPARASEGNIIADRLTPVELATIALILIVVGFTFRAFGAPVITLLAAGIAYIVAVHVIGYVARREGLTIPVEMEPILVVLILAVCTDYAIFFLSGTKRRLQEGDDRVLAACAATAEFVPIIFTAGLTIAGCTACFMLADLEFLRALGPALAIGVGTAVAVAITFIPACLAATGRIVFWPSLPLGSPLAQVEGRLERWRLAAARWLTGKRFIALCIALLCIAALGVSASGLERMRLGLPLLSDLPDYTQEAQATRAAMQGFTPGILSPTVIVIAQQGLFDHQRELAHLEDALARQKGVAAILGPRERAAGLANYHTQLAQLDRWVAQHPDIRKQVGAPLHWFTHPDGIIFSRDGTVARIAVIFDEDPLGAAAIDRLGALESAMPHLLRAASLPHAHVTYTGDTALARDTIDRTLRSMLPVSAAIAGVVFLLLALLLRSLVAPVYLLLSSILAAAAPLGLTAYLFQTRLGFPYLGYYAPLGAGVLLIALGSDYNLFVVGRVWEEARCRPLREAIAIAVPRATGAISMAAITLEASFALLLIVPLVSFRAFAFAMVIGVLIDAFVVRSYLVLALMVLFGRLSLWPRTTPPAVPSTTPATSPASTRSSAC